MILSVILSKTVHTDMCLILNAVGEIKPFESPDQSRFLELQVE
jgi:hypothetical protein